MKIIYKIIIWISNIERNNIKVRYNIKNYKERSLALPCGKDLALKLGVGEGGHFFFPLGGMLVIPAEDTELPAWVWCIICSDEVVAADDVADVATGMSSPYHNMSNNSTYHQH